MSQQTYRRSFVISVPTERLDIFYRSLERLKAQFSRFSQSAIIVHLVLDPSGERLAATYATRHTHLPSVPDMPAHIALDAYKSSLGVSLPEDLRQPFFETLVQLETHAGIKGKSAVIVDLVIKAAERLDEIVYSPIPGRLRERVRTQQHVLPPSPPVPLVGEAPDPHAIPALFRTLFYEQLQQEPADRQRTIAAITQTIDRFVPQAAAELALQALGRQLLGVLLRDNDDFNAALAVLDRAITEAQALKADLPAEAINLLAAAHYRRASIFWHQHKRLLPTERVARQGMLGEAQRALEAALEASSHPDCRPCVRGVIVLRNAALLALSDVHPLPPFEKMQQHLAEARRLAEDEKNAQRDGYDPVGFLHHPSGVHHTWAQITLELFQADVPTVPDEFSLARGEQEIAQALEHLPATWNRWRDGCELTHIHILRSVGIAKLKAATAITSRLLTRLAAQPSPHMHHDFDATLATLFATRDEISDALSTLIHQS